MHKEPVVLSPAFKQSLEAALDQRTSLSSDVKKQIITGHQYLNDKFYILMNVLAFEYAFILQSIKLEPSIKMCTSLPTAMIWPYLLMTKAAY
ncbi:MAG: hypothetical protein IPO65_17715 [Saprospiraceae bacterium]|nr:hypothetical protein [Saprospiraceae bacterium]